MSKANLAIYNILIYYVTTYHHQNEKEANDDTTMIMKIQFVKLVYIIAQIIT